MRSDSAVAVTLSIALHLGLLWALTVLPDSRPPVEELFEVAIVPDFAPPKREAKQIVSPPDQPQADSPPVETRNLSDQDFVTKKEQIRRGESPPPGPPPAPPQREQLPRPERRAPKPAPEKPAEDPKPKTVERAISKEPLALKLDDRTVAQKFSKPDRKSASNADASNPRPFSRPSGSGAAFMGTGGTTDFIPNLPDGDITLLNAKANQYAGFVRRVATQVFSHLRSVGWNGVTAGDIRSIGDYTTVRAILAPDGKFLQVQLLGNSGSSRFDGVVVEATRRGAKDQNPPKGAAAPDGTFRFIFKSKSWAEIGADPRNGAPHERRWLLLATGLE